MVDGRSALEQMRFLDFLGPDRQSACISNRRSASYSNGRGANCKDTIAKCFGQAAGCSRPAVRRVA